jgi:hypothetical protein
MKAISEDRQTLLDALATLAESQLKMIQWKAELASQIVRLHSLEGEIERAYRSLAAIVKRGDVSGADPG